MHGQCGVCFESRRLQQLVVLGADELAICRLCFESAAHFARLGGGHPLLFDSGATAVTRAPRPGDQDARTLCTSTATSTNS